MKFFSFYSFLFCFLLFLSSKSFAFFTKSEVGREIFAFSKSFQSARTMALERSASAFIVSDPSIMQLNPAAFIFNDSYHHLFSFHFQTGVFAENQGNLSYTRQLSTMSIQASYGWLLYGDIEGYDEYGQPTGQVHSPQSQLFTLSSSIPLRLFRFGSTIKLATDKLSGKLGDRTAIALAFDWGLVWTAKSNLYGFAFVARDFGALIRDYIQDGDSEAYAMAQTYALSAFLKSRQVPRLSLFLENTLPRYSQPALSLGLEYALGDYLFLRSGFNRAWLDLSRDFKELFASHSRPTESYEARFFSLGLGLQLLSFDFDYTFSYLIQGLGVEHRFSLNFRI